MKHSADAQAPGPRQTERQGSQALPGEMYSMQEIITTEAPLTVHVEFRLAGAVERAPMLLAGYLSIITDGIGLVRLIEGLKPEEIDAPIQKAADSGMPVGFHVVVACFGSAGVGAAGAWPAGFCDVQH